LGASRKWWHIGVIYIKLVISIKIFKELQILIGTPLNKASFLLCLNL